MKQPYLMYLMLNNFTMIIIFFHFLLILFNIEMLHSLKWSIFWFLHYYQLFNDFTLFIQSLYNSMQNYLNSANICSLNVCLCSELPLLHYFVCSINRFFWFFLLLYSWKTNLFFFIIFISWSKINLWLYFIYFKLICKYNLVTFSRCVLLTRWPSP